MILKNKNTRRQFIKGVGASVILSQIPFLFSCQNQDNTVVLSTGETQTIQQVLNILFPSSPGPGIKDIKVIRLINNYLSDPNIHPDKQKSIINGIHWTNEISQNKYKADFNRINLEKQEKIVKRILQKPWGELWISKLLTLTFEALLLDPVYGINTHEIGWKYLHHTPGKPRPNMQNKYPQILNRKKENIIITSIEQL